MDDPEKNIDHEGTQNVLVCPHCGNEQEDTDFCSNQSYEGEEQCDACGKKYSFFADFTIEWYTRKMEDTPNEDALKVE